MKFIPSWSRVLSLSLLVIHSTVSSATFWDDVESWIVKEAADGLADLSPPGVLAQKPFGYSETPPISTSLKNSHLQSDITVAIWDSDASYEQPEAFHYFEDLFSGYNQSWFGIAIGNFDAIIETEVILAGSADGNYTLSLLKKTVSYDGIGVEVDFQLYMTAEASAAITFTAGLELTLNNPAAIMTPVFDPILQLNKSQMVGFNATLTPIFNATMPQLDISAMLSLRTVFSVTVEGFDVGSLTLDLPAFDFGVHTLQNKMSNCQTPPAGTPSDHIYEELIHLSGNLDAILSYDALDDEFSGQIHKWTLWNMFDKCYAFLPGSDSIGSVPPTSKDSVLTAKPVTTCTTDGKPTVGAVIKTLSRGDKAAIAIGTFIGVILIAALAFCGGRASQRRSNRKHNPDSMNGNPNGGLASIFRRTHGDRLDGDGFVSSLPIRQVDEDSAFLPDSAMEVRTAPTHRIWPKRKPLPFVEIEETSQPPLADLSLGGDIGSAIGRIREPGLTWNGNNLESTRYWAPGDISAEGQRLLRDITNAASVRQW